MFKRTLRDLLLFLPLVSAAFFAGPPAYAQDSVALLIGNGEYERAPRLKNPVNDASALAKKLHGLGFMVLHGHDLTRDELVQHVESFGSLMEDAEIAVFFYAGHGLQVNGRNYLIPVDFNLEAEADPTSQLVSLDEVLREMVSDQRVNLIFLDACRDNPFADELSRIQSNSRSVAADSTRGIKVVAQGLAKVEGGVGTLIAFATQPGNVALDGTGDHSPFTTGLLEYMGNPGTEVSDMLRNVRKHVYEVTDGKQIPWDHSSLVEKYFFKKKKQRSAPPP
jgi:uncharacterized caspase-like protein